MNCIDKINNDNMDENSTKIRKYLLYKEPILEYCDLNISFLLKCLI